MIGVRKDCYCSVCGRGDNAYRFKVFTNVDYQYTIRLCDDCRHELINCLKFVDSEEFKKDIRCGSEVFYNEGNE